MKRILWVCLLMGLISCQPNDIKDKVEADTLKEISQLEALDIMYAKYHSLLMQARLKEACGVSDDMVKMAEETRDPLVIHQYNQFQIVACYKEGR